MFSPEPKKSLIDSPDIADTDAGTSCKDCTRFCAVTITSSRTAWALAIFAAGTLARKTARLIRLVLPIVFMAIMLPDFVFVVEKSVFPIPTMLTQSRNKVSTPDSPILGVLPKKLLLRVATCSYREHMDATLMVKDSKLKHTIRRYSLYLL